MAPVVTFAMYQSMISYKQLIRAVKDFISGVKAFQAVLVTKDTSNQKNKDYQAKEIKLMARLDARVKNMEAKIDTLAD